MGRRPNPQKVFHRRIELVDRKGNPVVGRISMPYEIANIEVDCNGDFIGEEFDRKLKKGETTIG